jgi:hypothetical protein
LQSGVFHLPGSEDGSIRCCSPGVPAAGINPFRPDLPGVGKHFLEPAIDLFGPAGEHRHQFGPVAGCRFFGGPLVRLGQSFADPGGVAEQECTSE